MPCRVTCAELYEGSRAAIPGHSSPVPPVPRPADLSTWRQGPMNPVQATPRADLVGYVVALQFYFR